jgi:hypothetical protein
MGRPKKAGKRTKSGRLSRGPSNFDKGTERAQAMIALYGPDGCDAIGRLYQAGFLGEGEDAKGNEAKALLDMARKVSRLYWRAYETGAVKSCIADSNFGAIVDIDHARVKQQELWLSESLRIVNSMGRNVRRSFDQLVVDVNPDHGPPWVDALLSRKGTDNDKARLREALDGLEALF